MAKRKESDSIAPSADNGLSVLSSIMSKVDKDITTLSETSYAKIDDYISTGSYILNACVSGSLFKGVPNRRIVTFVGEEGTGKTFLALSVCREAQKKGYTPIYIDTEASIDPDFVIRLGVDPNKMMVKAINTIQELTQFIAQLISQLEEHQANGKEVPKIILVIDSIGNLSSEKEMDDAIAGKGTADMTKQRLLRSFFRINGVKMSKLGMSVVLISHVYEAIGSYVPTKKVSGGGGILFNSSSIMMLSKSKLEDKNNDAAASKKTEDAVNNGVKVTVKPVKSRFCKPIKVSVHIPFYTKLNPYVGLEKYISWENCGIMRGKCLTAKEYEKLSSSEQNTCHSFTDKNGDTLYALPKDKARTLVCKHLGGEVDLIKLFTPQVLSQEVLEELDNKVIKPLFELPTLFDENMDESMLNELVNDSSTEINDEENIVM